MHIAGTRVLLLRNINMFKKLHSASKQPDEIVAKAKLLDRSSNEIALQTPWRRRTPTLSSVVLTVLCNTDDAACRLADVHRWWRDGGKGQRRAAECDDCQSPLQMRYRESRRRRVGLDSRRVVNWTDAALHLQRWLQRPEHASVACCRDRRWMFQLVTPRRATDTCPVGKHVSAHRRLRRTVLVDGWDITSPASELMSLTVSMAWKSPTETLPASALCLSRLPTFARHCKSQQHTHETCARRRRCRWVPSPRQWCLSITDNPSNRVWRVRYVSVQRGRLTQNFR